MSEHRRPTITFSDAPRGTCRWCGEAIVHEAGEKAGQPNRRRRWHEACLAHYKQSDPREARRRVRKRDRGRCAACGVDPSALRRTLRGPGLRKRLVERGFRARGSLWEVDHIVPLVDGGGHELANLQTLCTPCHRTKTAREARARAARPNSGREAPAAPGRAAAVEASREGANVATPERRNPCARDRHLGLDDLLAEADAVNARAEAALARLGVSRQPLVSTSESRELADRRPATGESSAAPPSPVIVRPARALERRPEAQGAHVAGRSQGRMEPQAAGLPAGVRSPAAC